MTKNQIRSIQKEQRNKLTFEERKLLSKAIREKLFHTEQYQLCQRLFTFVSFQSEVDTYELIRQALTDGKSVYIPRVETANMEFFEVDNLEGLIPSKIGVLEPQGIERQWYTKTDNDINLMILPGLAFDPSGNRIGYGAGYYDRYLNAHMEDSFYKIALAYDFQIMDQITAEEFDVKADSIITPERIIYCS